MKITSQTKSTLRFAIPALVLLFTLACGMRLEPEATQQPGSTPVATITAPAQTRQPDADAIRVYFTNPGGVDTLQDALLADLQAAQSSVDIAMYNFSLRRVADALIAAHARGVQVRFVADSDALDGSQFERLGRAGIKVVGDRREALMHNKFVVIDAAIVWAGSLNLTGSGLEDDNNNLVRLESAQLAENYTTEFEEMYLDDQFGSDSPANTPRQEISIGGVAVENYFSPDDRISPRLVRLISAADSSVEMLAYSFTSDPLSQALLDQAQSGRLVRAVFEADLARSNTGGDFDRLERAGLDVRLDGNAGLMHHKVIIIDRATVIFGSYNFTTSADRRNDENVLVIHDARVARVFLTEFEAIYAQSGR